MYLFDWSLPVIMRSRRYRLADGRRGQKRETWRDEAPEASSYATADLLTYISKQKQLAGGYWNASPTQHNTRDQGKNTRAAESVRTGHGV